MRTPSHIMSRTHRIHHIHAKHAIACHKHVHHMSHTMLIASPCITPRQYTRLPLPGNHSVNPFRSPDSQAAAPNAGPTKYRCSTRPTSPPSRSGVHTPTRASTSAAHAGPAPTTSRPSSINFSGPSQPTSDPINALVVVASIPRLSSSTSRESTTSLPCFWWGRHSVQRAPLSTNGEPGRPKPPQI